MTPEQFVYWLQGFVEISKPHERSSEYYDVSAWQEIKNHLELVLTKKTPNIAADMWEEKEDIKQRVRKQMPVFYPTFDGALTC